MLQFSILHIHITTYYTCRNKRPGCLIFWSNKKTFQNFFLCKSVLCTPPFEKSPIKAIGFMYSPLWKITHQKPSVLCTPPLKNHCFWWAFILGWAFISVNTVCVMQINNIHSMFKEHAQWIYEINFDVRKMDIRRYMKSHIQILFLYMLYRINVERFCRPMLWGKTRFSTGFVCEGLTVEQILEVYGEYFYDYAVEFGYVHLLRVLGKNPADFLMNLDTMHLALARTFPSSVAAEFSFYDLRHYWQISSLKKLVFPQVLWHFFVQKKKFLTEKCRRLSSVDAASLHVRETRQRWPDVVLLFQTAKPRTHRRGLDPKSH